MQDQAAYVRQTMVVLFLYKLNHLMVRGRGNKADFHVEWTDKPKLSQPIKGQTLKTRVKRISFSPWAPILTLIVIVCSLYKKQSYAHLMKMRDKP